MKITEERQGNSYLARRRKIARALLAIFIINTQAPNLFVLAAPQEFVRPSAGVSNIPLNVTQYNAPGFGDISEAVNLANGNLYFDAGGVSRNSAPASEKTISGGPWNVASRMRLYGYESNLITDQNLASTYWKGTPAKPDTSAYRLSGTGCGGSNFSSGIKRLQTLAAGRYKVSFEGRASIGTLAVGYGLDQNNLATATLTADWQVFSTEFTTTTTVDSIFQVFENADANQAWDLGNIIVTQFDTATNTWGNNLVWNQNIDSTDFTGYCVKPDITLIASGLLRGPNGFVPATIATGLMREETLPADKYTLTFEAKVLTGTLPITWGIDETNSKAGTLTNQWQTLKSDFTLTAASTKRLYISENIQYNESWQVRNISLVASAPQPTSFTLGMGAYFRGYWA